MNVSRRSFLECMTLFAAGRAFAAPHGMFSGGSPELVFAAVSDVHIVHPKANSKCGTQVFERALDWYRQQGIDAVMIAGDLADSGLVDELEMLGAAWRKMFPDDKAPDGRHVEKVFVTGNHDYEAWRYSAGTAKKLYPDEGDLEKHKLVSHYPETWKSAFGEKYEPIYMKTIRGYKFIGSHWTDGRGRQWGNRLGAFLAAHGAELKGDKPFFYVQHPHLNGTVFNAKDGVVDDGVTTKELSSYPNAVAFSGHSHWSITDERSIWQGGFTSVNLGCLRRTGFCRTANAKGGGYENWRTPGTRRKVQSALKTNSLKAMPLYPAANLCHHGSLVKAYSDRIVIERLELTKMTHVATDWVIPLASSERPYDIDLRAAQAIAPQFAPDAKLAIERIETKNRAGKTVSAVKLTFPAANDVKGTRPFDYKIEIVDGDGKSTFRAVLAQGVEYAQDSGAAIGPSHCILSLDTLPKGPLMFKVHPGECFGKLGNPIAAKFKC